MKERGSCYMNYHNRAELPIPCSPNRRVINPCSGLFTIICLKLWTSCVGHRQKHRKTSKILQDYSGPSPSKLCPMQPNPSNLKTSTQQIFFHFDPTHKYFFKTLTQPTNISSKLQPNPIFLQNFDPTHKYFFKTLTQPSKYISLKLRPNLTSISSKRRPPNIYFFKTLTQPTNIFFLNFDPTQQIFLQTSTQPTNISSKLRPNPIFLQNFDPTHKYFFKTFTQPNKYISLKLRLNPQYNSLKPRPNPTNIFLWNFDPAHNYFFKTSTQPTNISLKLLPNPTNIFLWNFDPAHNIIL